MSSRRDEECLNDIVEAITAIRSHLSRGDLSDGLIFDAVRLRLIEIGEAVKLLDAHLVASVPEVKWSEAAGMRGWLPITISIHPEQSSKQRSRKTCHLLRQQSFNSRRDSNSPSATAPTFKILRGTTIAA